ncbi:ankyrin repeat domain-containing protein [Aspergillus homomorphus CBS 101889]|uniref:Ankyrin n=1 Tax=Aspergillus homomorphus (strain CBS 101889) TaxID=1450537 RepID=A0A395HJ37_ASPHC|nr:ankyrin [Aspergillus homomorphus CBS 101889]RAL07931.1 ankyrin [Aspergillus homomorphus CBS 101889]
MDLSKFPSEILEPILEHTVPQDWNSREEDFKVLDLRRVCKRFNVFISLFVLIKIQWGDLKRSSAKVNRDCLRSLLVNKILFEVSSLKPEACSILLPIMSEIKTFVLGSAPTGRDLDRITVFTVKNMCSSVMSYQQRKKTCEQFIRPDKPDPVSCSLIAQKLITAVCTGQIGVVQALISRGCDVNCHDKALGTPLFAAFEMGRLDIAKLLLDHGADPNIVGYESSPLAIAAMRGDLAIVLFLLTYPAVDVNLKCSKGSPLFWACNWGRFSVVNILLHHPKINWRSGRGENWTPFGAAAGGGFVQLVQLFLNVLGSQITWDDMIDALWRAVTRDHVDVVQLLLQTLKHRFQGFQAGNICQEGCSMLCWATKKKAFNVAYLLLQRRDVNPNGVYTSPHIVQDTPLSHAVEHKSLAMVEILLQRQDLNPNIKNIHQLAPLQMALISKQMNIVDALLQDPRVDPNTRDNFGGSPLFLAVEYNYIEIARKLIQRSDVMVNMLDVYDRSALSYAAEHGRKEIVDMLLHHPDIESTRFDSSGRTPAFWAAAKGHDEVIRRLLNHDPTQVNLRNPGGSTCLTYAARRGHLLAVMVLVEFGAVMEYEDSWGFTALEWAQAYEYYEIQRVLMTYMFRQQLARLRAGFVSSHNGLNDSQ